MRKNFKEVIGVNSQGNFIFADVNLRWSDEKGITFSASFDEVKPVVLTDALVRSRTRSIIQSMPEQSLSMLDLLDMTIEDAVDKFLNRRNFQIEDVMDISLHSKFYWIDGVEEDIVMESVGCGQLDIDKMEIDYFYPSMAEYLIDLWLCNHLDTISAHNEKKIRDYFNRAEKLQPEDWILNKIKSIIGN